MPDNRIVRGHELLGLMKPGTLDPDSAANLRDIFGDKSFRPIEADSRLYLDVVGHGEEERFIARFRQVWHSIPSGDRASILDHWPDWERIPGVLGVPFRLESISSMLQSRMSGVCEGPGISLVFFAPVVDRLPVKHVAALVAHELAHVLQASWGPRTPAACPAWLTDDMAESTASDHGTTAEVVKSRWTYHLDPYEHEANAIAKRWGFNALAMGKWIVNHIDWEDLPAPPY